MDFTKVITGRESIRSYDPTRPVDKAVLERILDAGRIAPSAANRQPWRFVVVSSRETLSQLRRCY
ncbi:MAG TPA: nitroreductase family protein, partial [Spirochaetia bacterium]